MGPLEQSFRQRAVDARLRLFAPSKPQRRAPLLIPPPPVVVEEVQEPEPQIDTLKPTTARGIILAVCRKHGVKYDELMSMSRRPHIVQCRQECCYVLRHSDIRVLGKIMSLPAIGRHLGGLDHTTVLYSIRKHAKMLSEAASEPNGNENTLESASRWSHDAMGWE